MYNDDWNEEENDDDLTKEAVERFEEMLKSRRTTYFDADEFDLIIEYYLKQNNLERSREAVNLALEQHPDDLDIRIKNGYFNATTGNHQEAIDIYTQALDELEEDKRGEMYYAIGYEYHSMGMANKAIEYYHMALEENPQDTEVWSALGDLFRGMDRLEDAIEMYEYVLAIDPTHLWANMHLANSYYDLDRFQEAIDSLNEAIAHGVDTAMVHASLGDCHYRLGQFIDAREEYGKAININEYLTEAWSGLGYVYSDTGESQKAIKYFTKAYSLEPFNDDHLYNLAAEYRKINENQKALECLLEIEKSQPNDPDLYFFLGDLLADMDRMDEGICYLKLGLERTNNDSLLLYLLAYLHLEKGDRVTALGYLDEALTANPDYAKEFIEYNPEMLTNDVEVMEMLEKIKDKR